MQQGSDTIASPIHARRHPPGVDDLGDVNGDGRDDLIVTLAGAARGDALRVVFDRMGASAPLAQSLTPVGTR
jgi:hypothetical protein